MNYIVTNLTQRGIYPAKIRHDLYKTFAELHILLLAHLYYDFYIGGGGTGYDVNPRDYNIASQGRVQNYMHPPSDPRDVAYLHVNKKL